MLFFRFVALCLTIKMKDSPASLPDRLTWRSFFKTLIDHEVTVELKNDIQIRGTLKSVDQYLNIKLDDISVVEELKYPHLVSISFSSVLRRLLTPEPLLALRARSRTSSSGALLCATSICPPAPLTCRCWRMPREEVSTPIPYCLRGPAQFVADAKPQL